MSEFDTDYCYDYVAVSRQYAVPVFGEEHLKTAVELSVVVSRERYGLVQVEHYTLYGKTESLHSEEVLLECRYDNLYFVETLSMCWLVTLNSGKSGVYALFAAQLNENSAVLLKEVLPCVYDRIDFAEDSFVPLLLAYREQTVQYYTPSLLGVSAQFESIERIVGNILLCQNKDEAMLIDYTIQRMIYQIENGWKCFYICNYTDGYVFRVMKDVTYHGEPMWESGLLFYSLNSGNVQVTPVFSQVRIHAIDKEHGCFYVTALELLSKGVWKRYAAKDDFWTEQDTVCLMKSITA